MQVTEAVKKAFTLIELVVVVIILGILIAIASFTYHLYLTHTRQVALQASAAQVDQAMMAKSAAEDVSPLVLMNSLSDKSSDGLKAALGVSGDYTLANIDYAIVVRPSTPGDNTDSQPLGERTCTLGYATAPGGSSAGLDDCADENHQAPGDGPTEAPASRADYVAGVNQFASVLAAESTRQHASPTSDAVLNSQAVNDSSYSASRYSSSKLAVSGSDWQGCLIFSSADPAPGEVGQLDDTSATPYSNQNPDPCADK